jgi:hypothetical protein
MKYFLTIHKAPIVSADGTVFPANSVAHYRIKPGDWGGAS